MLALFITARHSCQSSHTGSSPRLWDVLFFSSPSRPQVKDTFPQLQCGTAGKKKKKKLWHQAGTKASWMIDARMLTHHTGEGNQYFDLKRNKIYICWVEQRRTQVAEAADNFAAMLPVFLCAMRRYHFSLFHNLLAAEIARYRIVGLALSDSLRDACAFLWLLLCFAAEPSWDYVAVKQCGAFSASYLGPHISLWSLTSSGGFFSLSYWKNRKYHNNCLKKTAKWTPVFEECTDL